MAVGPASAGPARPPRRGFRPGRLGRVLALAGVALLVVLAAIGLNAYLTNEEATLTIVTYESLFGGCGSANLTAIVDGFESAHHVHVNLDCYSGTLSSLLIDEKGSVGIDLVIGLDEITAPQADAAGVLLPYTPPEVADEPAALQAEIAPDHSVTPYEYGYLGIDYTPSFDSVTSGAVRNFSLEEVAANATWARALMIEDPETDITGEEFLLAEIAYSQSVLHENWTDFWRAADPSLRVSDSWSDAYDAFTTGPNAPPMLVSYSTDPAAALTGSGPPSFNATLFHGNGTTFAWRTVYGIGIVRGTPHLALAEAFEDDFLEGPVQSEIPTNEWVYPANDTVALPSSFGWAADPTGAVDLNGAIPPSEIVAGLPGWLSEWQTLYDAFGP